MNEHSTNEGPSETLHLRVGQSLEISVGPSEARNGYVWLMRGLPDCVALESTHDDFSQQPAHGRMAARVFRVIGCHPGDGLIHCVLTRPWEPDDAVEERRFRMVVDSTDASHGPH